MSKEPTQSEDDQNAPMLPSWTPAELARKTLDPLANAARTARCYSNTVPGFELSFGQLVEGLAEQCEAVSLGDLTRPEVMLLAQAHTLDAIFNKLMALARDDVYCDFDKSDRRTRLALKAQNQCRVTLEALLTHKRPPTIIAQQANVTSGPQQINNAGAFAPETQTEQSKQSGGDRELLPDARASAPPISVDTPLEAVGAVYRPEDDGR